jgi:fatty-acid desaturase
MIKSSLPKIRLAFFINCSLILLLPILGVVSWDLQKVYVVLALYFLFDCLGIVLTYHRYHAHRGFEFKYKWVEILFTLFGVLSCSGSPIGWVAIHNDHHKYSDKVKDPHSPIHGIWRVMTIDYPYTKDKWGIRSIVTKPYQRFIHKYYFGIIGVYVISLFLTLGIEGVYLGFIAPSVFILVAQGLTNFINHKEVLGYRNFDFPDQSKNIWWLALFNFGEGWHNNHHANPGNYTTKYKWWEFDMAGTIAKLVRA